MLVISGGYCAYNSDLPPNNEPVHFQPNDIEQQECAVYSILLDNLCATNSMPVLLAEETSLSGLEKNNLREELKYVDRRSWGDDASEIITKFILANEHTIVLKSCSNAQVKTIFLHKRDVDAVREKPMGWVQFLIKYPKQSLWEFSKIAFNSDATKALVYVAKESGGKAGQGSFVILVKQNNAWVIKHRIVAWVS
jgi:hypothetical protein